MVAYTYRATAVYGSWYDGEKARGFEGHFKATLSGSFNTNRIKLTKFIVPIFQKQIFQKYGLRLSPAQIRIRGFERRERASSSSREVQAEFLEMTYRGRQCHARRFTPQIFRLPKPRKRSRKRRSKSRKRRIMRRRTSRWLGGRRRSTR